LWAGFGVDASISEPKGEDNYHTEDDDARLSDQCMQVIIIWRVWSLIWGLLGIVSTVLICSEYCSNQVWLFEFVIPQICSR
jgi:hypothetical protein